MTSKYMFIVEYRNYDDSHVTRVFNNLENAEKYAEEMNKQSPLEPYYSAEWIEVGD